MFPHQEHYPADISYTIGPGVEKSEITSLGLDLFQKLRIFPENSGLNVIGKLKKRRICIAILEKKRGD